jgi:tetratricopeptide (TPR) repeat protein
VLIGLLAGYLMHNIVVFDNIISYIFYGCVLALVHAHVSTHFKKVEAFTMNPQMIGQFVAPIVIIIAGAGVYFLNAPGIAAAKDIIDAMMAQDSRTRLEEFVSALERKSFADQEIVEQLAQQAMSISRNPKVAEEDRAMFIQRSELELLRMTEEKPGDARLHAFLSSFYRSIGAMPQAQEQAAKARELSPNKQAIIIEQGIIEIQLGDIEKAKEFLKTAFELDESNTEARVLYAAVLAGHDQMDEAKALIGKEYLTQFAQSDFALSMVDQGGDKELLIEMFEARIAADPTSAQNRASLAYIYYEQGESEKAIEVLEKAAEEISTFAPSATCFIGNLKKGVKPDEGC